MKLYHYSNVAFNELRTRRKQGVSDEVIVQSTEHAKRIGDPGPYIDHISLFLEPVPVDVISSIFKHQHSFWKAGDRIYEHVVETDTLETDILFSIVETPVIDRFTDQFDWSITDKAVRTKYLLSMNAEMERLKLTAHGRNLLIEGIKPFIGKTTQLFIAARKRSDADMTAKQYAANVPHLMVYPKSGVITVKSVKPIVLGNRQYTELPKGKSTMW